MKFYGDRKLSMNHPPIYNVTVSNVAGPDFPMYFCGAKVAAIYPLGPIFHGLASTSPSSPSTGTSTSAS